MRRRMEHGRKSNYFTAKHWRFLDGEAVLNHLNLNIRDGEFVTLLGPSGCGKTTTLRIIGGFVRPDEGDVFFNGQRITDLPPHKREVNTIFQNTLFSLI